MAFVGIISNFEVFSFLEDNNHNKNVNIININKNNVKNLKNIRFETIVICNDINEMENGKKYLNEIIKNSKYLVINSDYNSNNEIFDCCEKRIITYGTNQKATITTSSVKEDEILICIQRNIKTIKNKIIEIQECRLKNENINNTKVYNLLASFVIELLYT